MKLVVTGAAGQLGRDVVLHAESLGDDVVAVDKAALDITDPVAVGELLSSLRPDAVINAAAYTAVDACETNESLAYAVNADAVGHLSAACETRRRPPRARQHRLRLRRHARPPVSRGRSTNPQSVYGKSKLAGEIAAGPNAAIVRTSWVCGEHGNNMVKLVLRLAANPDQALAFVDDQRGHPTFTADLAPALRTLGGRSPLGHPTT